MQERYTRQWERKGRRRGKSASDESPVPRRGDRSASDEARDSYYGLPVIHKPHWKWLIIWYFYLGGIAGASYALAALARLGGAPGGERIARAGRYLSLAALLPCPPLLILDLGRPERFYRMLRVVKLRSPMSVGTWILSGFGGVCGLAAVGQAGRDGLLGDSNPAARLARAIPTEPLDAVGLPFAFGLSGYTGVLLAATAVPLWTRHHLVMGPLFLASSLSNASAALSLALLPSARRGDPAHAAIERVETVAALSELALLTAFEYRLGPTLGRPLREGHVGRVYRLGALGMGIAAPLALRLGLTLAGRHSRPALALASALTLVGGFAFRYAMVIGGRLSADDPHATFELTRGASDADESAIASPLSPGA